MKTVFTLCVMGTLILGLTACEMKVKVPGVKITTQDNGCPPGQAKKGRC